jgi:hypothetical protein
MERSCHVKANLISDAAKNLTASASAGSAIDFVSVAGVVTVHKFNKLIETMSIDFKS